MRICFIGDAGSIHVQRWVGWFASSHEVMLISTTPDDGSSPYEVVSLPSEGRARSRLIRSMLAVRRTVNACRPDVVHSHFINEAGWFGAASRHHPLIVTAWGSDVYRAPLESRLARYLNPHVARAADRVTCDSEDQAAMIRGWGVAPHRVTVVGWGVEREEFHPGVSGARLRRRLDIPADAQVVLSPRQWLENSNVGAIVAAHEQLADGVHLILKRSPATERGAGRAIEETIARSSARARIRVLGNLDAAELPEMYAAADVVVSLCRTDGTPVSVLEAMATGKPLVAFRNASLSEWVAPPGGLLVDSVAAEAVAAAVRTFLEDREAAALASSYNCSVIAERADRRRELGRMEGIYAELAAMSGKR